MKGTVIVYHGTNAVCARNILKNGFKKGTYFAVHLEDAIGYGGCYIFEVAYPVFMIPNRNWQFISVKVIPTEFIVRLTKYNPTKVIIDNMVLRHMVCISNSTKAEIAYIKQSMKEHPHKYTKDEFIAYDVAVPQGAKV